MLNIINLSLAFFVIFTSCSSKPQEDDFTNFKWESRLVSQIDSNLASGKSYLPIYRQIFNQEDKLNHKLSITVSIRNTSPSDTIFLKKITYHNTEGLIIRSYLGKTVYLKPLETIDFGVAENTEKQGIGSSFIFEWASRNILNKPLFEAVMLMTAGQQGISFTSKAIQIE